MAEPWIGVVNRAIPIYEKGAKDLTLVRNLALSMMESRGLIKTGVDGSFETKYLVDWKEPPVTGLAYGSTASYEPRDYTKWAEMDWRGMQATDAMHLQEYEQIKGSTGELVNRYKRIVPKKTKAIREKVGQSLYVDGDDADHLDDFHGFDTALGVDGNEVAGDILCAPDDTYHGLATDLGASGTWSNTMSTQPCTTLGSDFPEGEGTRDYHYWSPLLVNWSSNAWGTAQTGWEDNCLRALSRTGMWLRHTQNCTGDLVAMVAPNLMAGLKSVMESKVRHTQFPHAEATKLGFPDAMNWEGMALTTGYGVPADTVYVFDVSSVKLLFTTDKVVKTKPVSYDPDALTYKFFAYTFGDYRFLPKHLAKIKNFA